MNNEDVKALVEAADILLEDYLCRVVYSLNGEERDMAQAIYDNLHEQVRDIRGARPDPRIPTEKDIGKVCEFWDGDTRPDAPFIGTLHRIADDGRFYSINRGKTCYWRHARILPICQLISHDGSERQPDDWEGKGFIWYKQVDHPIYVEGLCAIQWSDMKAYLPARYIKWVE